MRFAPGAWKYGLVPIAIAIPAGIFSLPLGIGLVGLGCAVLLFFRDPTRTPPDTGILAPADGRISVIRTEGNRVRVGTFMNVWNVHVVRSPIPGTVNDVEHVSGGHRPAFSKESDRNERLHVTVEGSSSVDRVTLIAGTIARRIHGYIETGDPIDRGERIGHIAFGSRVDLLFDESVTLEDIQVDRGERVRAGETVLVESNS